MDYKQDYKKDLGRRIAISRIKAGLSQTELALLVGCNQSHIGFYEIGKRVPRDKSLKKIAEKLNIDYTWLKYGDATYYDVENTEYGTSYVVNHFPGESSIDTITSKLKKLNKDELKTIDETVNLLIMEKDNDELNKYLSDKQAKYIEELKKAKEIKKGISSEGTTANEMTALFKYYKNVFIDLTENKISLDKARNITWFKEVKKYPDLYDIYINNSDDPKTRKFVIEEIIKRKA